MEQTISNIYKVLKETDDLIECEESFHLLIYELFTQVNQIIKEKKLRVGKLK